MQPHAASIVRCCMFGGAGHIAEMNRSLKFNRAQRHSKRLDKKKQFNGTYKPADETNVQNTVYCSQKIQAFDAEFEKDRKRKFRLKVYSLLFLIVFVIGGVALILKL
jgi:urease beta subunit